MKKYFVKCGHYATVFFSFTFRVLCRVCSYFASSGLKGGDVDLSLFRLALQTFDPWFIGIIGSAGVLTALVPCSMLVMAASTLLAKNIYRTMVPSASDRQVAKVAKLFVPVVTLVAVLFTFKGGETIGALLLMGYSIVTQLFPHLYVVCFHVRLLRSKEQLRDGDWVISGCVYYFIWFNYSYDVSGFPQYIKDLNVGIVALLMNMIVMFIVSGFTKMYL